jgi:hypothetical protein
MNARTNHISVHEIGTLAQLALNANKSATIFGVSSRGIFLKLDNRKMVFLSVEQYRGPLTVNLAGETSALSTCSPNAPVSISTEGLRISEPALLISLSNASVWQPPPIFTNHIDKNTRSKRIQQFAMQVYQQKNAGGLGEMLLFLTGQDASHEVYNRPTKFIHGLVPQIQRQLTKGHWPALVEPLRSILGLGSGLTPSGDDFILGLLLSLNRWKSIFPTNNGLKKLNTKVIDSAYKLTTTLSANLIESAAQGLADERLIEAVDLLAAGKSQQPGTAKRLVSWGSSSGVDALVGMITTFTAG